MPDGRVTGHAGPVLLAALDDVARLVLPVACPGCDAPDVRWCESCLAPLRALLRRRERGAPVSTGSTASRPCPCGLRRPTPGRCAASWSPGRTAAARTSTGRSSTSRGARVRRSARCSGRCSEWSRGGRGSGGRGLPALPGAGRPRAHDAGRASCSRAGPRRSARACGRRRPRRLGDARAERLLLVHRGRARDQVGLGSRARGARLGTVAVAPGRLLGTGAGGLVGPLLGPPSGARRGPLLGPPSAGRRGPPGAPAERCAGTGRGVPPRGRRRHDGSDPRRVREGSDQRGRPRAGRRRARRDPLAGRTTPVRRGASVRSAPRGPKVPSFSSRWCCRHPGPGLG